MMVILNFIIVCLFGALVDGKYTQNIPKELYQNCVINEKQQKFEILPGTGWDNLVNLEMGRILDLNFSKCSFSNDNQFLLPNELSLTAVKKSNVELFSEMIDHFMNYTSLTSRSININGNGAYKKFKFGGSFSYEHMKIKNDQLSTKSKLTRIQLRYNVYQSMFEPDTPLYPTFKNRILDIAALVIENKDTLYPKYLADMIVRDYGTHIIRSMEAGAILSKTDALNSEYVKKYEFDSTPITTAASASFLNFFHLSRKYSQNVLIEEVDEFNKQCTKTHVVTLGGDVMGSKFNVGKWEKSVMANLVPIDRRGDPIYYVLTPRTLHELDDNTVNKVYDLIKEAVNRYYESNTRRGCLDILSSNFNSDANVDAGNCKSVETQFMIGGVFQTCDGPEYQCEGKRHRNPLTGGFVCPVEFFPLKLNSGLNICKEECGKFDILKLFCSTRCSYFETFWCYPRNENFKAGGYQFGGILEKEIDICPFGYISLPLGLRARICVTPDQDPRNPSAIKFGGLFSCSIGNPLAHFDVKNKSHLLRAGNPIHPKYFPKTCGQGYVARIVSIDRYCQISYCTETNKISLGSSPDLLKPPFIMLNFNPNSTKSIMFKNKRGENVLKDEHGDWNIKEINYQNKGKLIGSICGCLMFGIVMTLLLAFFQRRHYQKKMRLAENKFVTSSNIAMIEND